MQRVYADPTLKISRKDFATPRNGVSINLDCDNQSTEIDLSGGNGFGDDVEF